MIIEYKIQRKKNDDPKQLPEFVERKQQLFVEMVFNVLKKMSDEDCILLGTKPQIHSFGLDDFASAPNSTTSSEDICNDGHFIMK